MEIDTIKDLTKYLKQECFNQEYISIGTSRQSLYDGHGIDFNGEKYIYYYIERGKKEILNEFDTEKELCNYIFNKLKDNDSARQHCVRFTKSETKVKKLCDALSSRNIKYKTDRIIHKGKEDYRYRVFVFGRDVLKTRFLKLIY
jgi:hypothetical protein